MTSNPIAIYAENLEAFDASRAKKLHTELVAEGLAGIACVYGLCWPNYEPPNPPRPQRNREIWQTWRNAAGLPLYAWFNARADQVADAAAIRSLEMTLDPDGWLLDIEGNWTKGASLDLLLDAPLPRKHRIVSLAGTGASYVEYHYRGFDLRGYDVEWQAYWNSGEGPTPDAAVWELYRSPFVVPGWQYRHRKGEVYGWGKFIGPDANGELGIFDSYLIPRVERSVFGILDREWGWVVDDGVLFPADPKKPAYGLLMGRAPYARIRVALNVTRPIKDMTWEQAAASARIPGAKKRPVAIYLGENGSDGVIKEIARGAA